MPNVPPYPWDSTLATLVSSAFSGKMYGIFAVLFGFTYGLQTLRPAKKGVDFTTRFRVRMLWLGAFSLLTSAFYSSEILLLLALCGFLLAAWLPPRADGNTVEKIDLGWHNIVRPVKFFTHKKPPLWCSAPIGGGINGKSQEKN